MKTYGPYTAKDGRQRCVHVSNDGVRKVVSYPRVLMEAQLGRSLGTNEHVHHKDGNPLNNELSNLEVVDAISHLRAHSLKYTDNLVTRCIYCDTVFELTPLQQRNRTSEASRVNSKPKAGPFCSKQCSGRYGSDVQRAAR